MKANPNGTPVLGESARTLGVRIDGDKPDIPVKSNGYVAPNTGGMSAVPNPMMLMPYRRPKEFGGTGQDPVFRIKVKLLSPNLFYNPDVPDDKETHGTIQPIREMKYEEYKKALESTQNQWQKVSNP
jgi:hypothetical protein